MLTLPSACAHMTCNAFWHLHACVLIQSQRFECFSSCYYSKYTHLLALVFSRHCWWNHYLQYWYIFIFWGWLFLFHVPYDLCSYMHCKEACTIIATPVLNVCRYCFCCQIIETRGNMQTRRLTRTFAMKSTMYICSNESKALCTCLCTCTCIMCQIHCMYHVHVYVNWIVYVFVCVYQYYSNNNWSEPNNSGDCGR